MVVVASSSVAFCGEIHDAVKNGDLERVKALLRQDPSLASNKEAEHGFTPLDVAVINGCRDIAEFLLTHGADANAKDNMGETALHAAAAMGQKGIVELLLAYQAEVNAKDNNGDTPLHLAAALGKKDIAELLLANQADANAKDNIGETALHAAAATGQKDIAELLLVHNAYIVKDSQGITPLDLAEAKGHSDIVELLRQHEQRKEGFWQLLPGLLVDHPGDMSEFSKFVQERKEFLDAVKNGDLKKVQELLKDDPTLVSSKDPTMGRTPLHVAAVKDHKEIAEFLLAHGADVNAKDNSGDTPLHLANVVGHADVAALLRQHGAHE
jgi:ankyrin repeat protein